MLFRSEQITEIGEMLGHETEALAIVTSMEEQLEEVRQAIKEYYEAPDAPAPVTIFYEESHWGEEGVHTRDGLQVGF